MAGGKKSALGTRGGGRALGEAILQGTIGGADGSGEGSRRQPLKPLPGEVAVPRTC